VNFGVNLVKFLVARIIQKNTLAKIGYSLYMKVEKEIRNKTYHKALGISNFFSFSKFGKFGLFLSMKNHLQKLKSYFPGQNLVKIRQ
jgi:hypothetical protein